MGFWKPISFVVVVIIGTIVLAASVQHYQLAERQKLSVMRVSAGFTVEPSRELIAQVMDNPTRLRSDGEVARLALPIWVRNHLEQFEENKPVAHWHQIAWGTGHYGSELFHWFGYYDADGWLQMDLSIALNQKNVNSLVFDNLDVEVVGQDKRLKGYLDGTETHIGVDTLVDWKKGCEPNCNVVTIFKDKLLKPVNEALPDVLRFEFREQLPESRK